MTDTKPGRYYARLFDGSLVEVEPSRAPDSVICRRVADFPGASVPEGAAVSTCTRCRAPIVFNPANPIASSTPKICMQCGGIVPLPFPDK